MIDLYAATNRLVGSITDADLQVLIDGLEEESSPLLRLLREALGSSPGVEIRWQRR